MRTLWRLIWLLCSVAWAAARTWWAFSKDHGVEADDPDKERDA